MLENAGCTLKPQVRSEQNAGQQRLGTGQVCGNSVVDVFISFVWLLKHGVLVSQAYSYEGEEAMDALIAQAISTLDTNAEY